VVRAALDQRGDAAIRTGEQHRHLADPAHDGLTFDHLVLVAQVVPAVRDQPQERHRVVDPGGLAVAQVAADVRAEPGGGEAGVREAFPEPAPAAQAGTERPGH
jgi:hypothetical protein